MDFWAPATIRTKDEALQLKEFLSGDPDVGNRMRKHAMKLLDGFGELERQG